MPHRLPAAACLVLAAVFLLATGWEALAKPRDPFSAFVRGVERAFAPPKAVRKRVQSRVTPAPRPPAAALTRPLDAAPPDQTGKASWYGPGFHGRKTASGVTYDMNAPMCAHRKMRFGQEVRITNLENGRTARCIIRDRGPFVAGRIIDVSRLVANQLGMLKSGVARVSIAVME